MFRKKTVFVVGAGASREYGLPTGPELMGRIAHLLSGINSNLALLSAEQKTFTRQCLYYAERTKLSVKDVTTAARVLERALGVSKSIDDSLDTHFGNEILSKIGKAAIVQCIVQGETSSDLNTLSTPSNRATIMTILKDTWLPKFSKRAFEGVRIADVKSVFQNLDIISFNYDRCIEFCIRSAVADRFGLDEKRSAVIASTLRIHFPYGTIAPLPSSSDANGLAFGANYDTTNLFDYASNIKTFGEQSYDAKDFPNIKKAIDAAEQVIFLGFGFHEPNMKILEPTVNPQLAAVFSTAKDISDYNRRAIVHKISETFVQPRNTIAVADERNTLQKKIALATRGASAHELFDEFGMGF